LITDLIAAHEGGEKLTGELVDFCIVLLVGGNETTTNLLGNAILCFHEYPQAFDRLKSEPALPPLAIEEVLRYSPRFKPCSGLRQQKRSLAIEPFRLDDRLARRRQSRRDAV